MSKRARGGLEGHRSVLALDPVALPSREAVNGSQHVAGQKDLTAPSPLGAGFWLSVGDLEGVGGGCGSGGSVSRK